MPKQPRKSEPDLEFDLKSLGFDEEGETPEPDTGSIVNTLFEDQKTPGNARSFLAIFGYQRATRKEIRAVRAEHKDFRHWVSLRLAYAMGFIAAVLIGLEVYRTLKGGH